MISWVNECVFDTFNTVGFHAANFKCTLDFRYVDSLCVLLQVSIPQQWNDVEPVKSSEDNDYTEGEVMGDHRCENCGKMFYTRYVQRIGNCFCPECSAKMGVAKKEKEYKDAKEYWEARK